MLTKWRRKKLIKTCLKSWPWPTWRKLNAPYAKKDVFPQCYVAICIIHTTTCLEKRPIKFSRKPWGNTPKWVPLMTKLTSTWRAIHFTPRLNLTAESNVKLPIVKWWSRPKILQGTYCHANVLLRYSQFEKCTCRKVRFEEVLVSVMFLIDTILSL